MSVADARSAFFVDRSTGMLVGLFVLVQLVVAAVSLDAVTTTEAVASQQQGDVGFSLYMVGIIVLETIVLVTAWRYSSILPDWVWTGVKLGAIGSVVIIGLRWSVLTNGIRYTAGIVAFSAVAGPLVVKFDTYWILHNIAALTLTVLFAMLLGGLLEPRAVIAFLLLMTCWDMIAVWRSGWMEGLISVAADTHLPIYYILPTGAQVDMSRFRTWLADREDEKPDDVGAVLGVGDIAIPAALVASSALALPATSRGWAIAGVTIGGAVAMAVLRVSLSRGSTLPALPWITTGTLAGFGVGVLLSGSSLLAVIGGGIA